MVKLLNIRFIFLFLFLLLIPISAAQHLSVVSLDDSSIDEGSIVTTHIIIEVNNETGLAAAALTLFFNPDVVQPIKIINGDFDAFAYNMENTSGFVKIATFQIGPDNLGPGLIRYADVEFKAIGTEGSKTDLRVEVNTLKNGNGVSIPYQVIDGAIRINKQTTSDRITNSDISIQNTITFSENENGTNEEIIDNLLNEAINSSASSKEFNLNSDEKSNSTPAFSAFSFIIILILIKILGRIYYDK